MPESAPAIAAPPTVSRPDPDPTTLTTQSLYREVNALHDLIKSETNAVSNALAARLDGADRERLHLQAQIDMFPTEASRRIDTLRVLHQEKFDSIQVQFTERDTRTEQTSRDSKVAVDAALQAAKEAVGEQNKSSALAIAKSEASTTKQIDQQGLLIASSTQGLDDKIDDIKDRLTRIEGGTSGGHQAYGYIIGIAGTLVALIALLFNILRH